MLINLDYWSQLDIRMIDLIQRGPLFEDLRQLSALEMFNEPVLNGIIYFLSLFLNLLWLMIGDVVSELSFKLSRLFLFIRLKREMRQLFHFF